MKTGTKTLPILISLIFFFANMQASDYKSKRTQTKTFEAPTHSILNIINEYGNINIVEWDKNEVSFEVTITATAKSQTDADEIVKTVDVLFNQSNVDQSGFTTIMAQTRYNQLKNCRCSRSVDYRIMVPKSINYQFRNKYGNISMKNAKGNTEILIEYGNFKGENLSGNKNLIRIEYGNIDIQQLSGGIENSIKAEYGGSINIGTSNNKLSVKMEYSKMRITTADDLEIKSEYSDLSVQKAKTIRFTSEYENYNIGEVDIVTGKSQYTNISIDQLNKSLALQRIEYGKLDIKNVSSLFESINVLASYTPVNIKFEANPSFDMNIKNEYGSISIPDPSNNMIKSSKDVVRTTASGKVGNASRKASVVIENEYSPINLKW